MTGGFVGHCRQNTILKQISSDPAALEMPTPFSQPQTAHRLLYRAIGCARERDFCCCDLNQAANWRLPEFRITMDSSRSGSWVTSM